METLYRYDRSGVFGKQGDPLVVQRVGMQEICPPHEHDFIEIVLVVGGSGFQETATSRFPIHSGMLTVLRPGHWHAYLKCRRLVIYNCCFGSELLLRELSWLMDDPKLASLLWGGGEAVGDAGPLMQHLSPAAVARLRDILDRFRDEKKSTYGMKVAQLSLFLTTLSRELPGPGSEGVIQPAVRKTIRLVEGDLARAWTIRELAAACGCSPEYLIRLFRRGIGMTPYAYINRCRAEMASRLLLRSDATVAEIGEQVGWGEPCHFARRFRRHYGTTATLYRAQMT